MKLFARWGVAVLLSVAGFAVAWWVCQRQIRLDEGISIGIAGAVLTVMLAVAAWWAPRGGDDSAGGEGLLVRRARAARDVNMAGRDQIIADRVVIAVAGAAEPVVPRMLPRDVPAFVGREDELRTLAGLAGPAGGGRVVVSAIGGTAGVGKTALAVHATYRLLPQFPGGHLYADLRGYTEGQDPAEPGEVLEVFLRHLGVAAEEMPVTTEERSGLLRQELASRRVLMVLDNARTEAQVRPLLPGAGESLVLVTSRSALPGLEVDERISLDVLPEDEAVAMLVGVIGVGRVTAGPGAVRELAGLCARLPLALRIAGQVLAAHPAWPVAKMTQLLADEQGRLARLGAGDLQVRAAFEVSYRLLAAEDARLFRLLGLHPGRDFDVLAVAALAGIEGDEARQVVDRLTEASLVTEDASGRVGIHDLLRLFARGACQDADSESDREAAEARLVGYYVDLAGFLDSCARPGQRPPAAQSAAQAGLPLPSMRDALVLFGAERRCLLAALGLAALRRWDEQVELLSSSMGEPLMLLHYFDDMASVMDASLAAARRAGDTGAEGRALSNLGEAYLGLRRFDEAVRCYQESLAIFRETSNRCGEGAALANLGNVHLVLRRFDEAFHYHQGSLAICRELGDRQGEGTALGNLGNVNQGLRRFDEAVGCYLESLAICREVGDRRGEGAALNNLGYIYKGLRRFEEAITWYQRDIAICRDIGDRNGEGWTLTNLGAVYLGLRRFDEAVRCYQESLPIFRETGDRHSEGKALNGLGFAYRKLRHGDQAAMCWREAAAAMRDSGDHERAGELEQQAAGIKAPWRSWLRRGN